MVGRLLQELSFRFLGEDRPAPTQSLLDGLFDVGEKVLATEWPEGSFRVSPRLAWAGLVHQVLLAWGVNDAGLHLERSFRSANSTSIRAVVFVQRARELGKMSGNSGDPPTITAGALDAVGKILLPEIEKDAADGALRHVPRIWDIVLAWKYLGGAPEAKGWLNGSMSESADFMSKVTESFVSYAVGSEPRHYEMTELPDPDLFDLETILNAARKHLQGNELTVDARNRIGVVAKKVERQLAFDREEQARKKQSESKEESP
jgi:hypothetical protein